MIKTSALVLALASGCSLYDGGDDGPPVDEVDAGAPMVDAAPQPVMTTYSVQWSCVTTGNCVSPLSGEDLATFRELDGAVNVSWYSNGATVPAALHDGMMSGDCLQVLAGSDLGFARSNYNACPLPGAPAPTLEATITWSTSTWHVVLTRI